MIFICCLLLKCVSCTLSEAAGIKHSAAVPVCSVEFLSCAGVSCKQNVVVFTSLASYIWLNAVVWWFYVSKMFPKCWEVFFPACTWERGRPLLQRVRFFCVSLAWCRILSSQLCHVCLGGCPAGTVGTSVSNPTLKMASIQRRRRFFILTSEWPVLSEVQFVHIYISQL